MKHAISCQINDNYQIVATDEMQHRIVMDIKKQSGGNDSGFLPMPVMLASLGGCLSVDVKLILEKMKCPAKSITSSITGYLDTEASPKVYKKIEVNILVTGKIEQNKLERALQLAEQKYCNVSAMLKQIVPIETIISSRE